MMFLTLKRQLNTLFYMYVIYKSEAVQSPVQYYIFYLIDRGVMSVSWSPKDSELLLGCGKDDHVICWNPNSATPVSFFFV